VERFFPKRMRWKLRINAGDGSCLGFQDLDFDSIVGNATLKMGEERGVISLQIRDIAASIGISNFSVKGATVRSQVTKMVLTPTVNRLDFHLAGDWTLVLKYEPATEQNNYQAKWVEDKQRSTLESLRLNREMSGLSALRLPKKIIEYLATSLIPSAINESVKNSFSPSLGNTLLEKSHNKIVLEGKIKIEQDINSKVWRAPFVGNTMSAKMARESLHLSDEEATWLDLLLRGTDAGFRRKTSSMYRLHKWRLLYAAQPVSRLKEICQLIQQDSSVYGFGQPKDENLDGRQSFADSKENSTDKVPEDWLFQIIDSVEDFADKDVKCKLELYKIDFDLDLTNVVRFFADSHLISLEEQALNAKSQNAKRAATKRKVATEQRIKNAQVWFSNTVMPLLTRNYYANVNGYLQGGLDAGSLGLTLQDFSGGVFMNNFSYDALLGWSPSKLSGWNLNIQGDQDQTNSNETAYSIRFKHKFMDKEDELYDRDHSDEDARVTMKDVDLKLFPRGYDPGAVELKGEQLQAWVTIAALSEFLVYWFVYPEEELQDRHKKLIGQKSLETKSSVVSMIHASDAEESNFGNVTVNEEILVSRQKLIKLRKALADASHKIADESAEIVRETLAAEKEKKQAKKMRNRRASAGRKQILSPEKNFVATVQSGNVESIRKDNLAHPYIPRLLLDSNHDFSCFVSNLVVQASKVRVEDDALNMFSSSSGLNADADSNETISLTLERASKYNNKPFAVFQMNWSLHDMFDDVEKNNP